MLIHKRWKTDRTGFWEIQLSVWLFLGASESLLISSAAAGGYVPSANILGHFTEIC